VLGAGEREGFDVTNYQVQGVKGGSVDTAELTSPSILDL